MPAAPKELLMEIGGATYNITAYAVEHPGGEAILRRFEGRDATAAFERAHHSDHAREILARYRIGGGGDVDGLPSVKTVGVRGKLFTEEDRSNVHKVLGIAALLHFVARFAACSFSPMAGFGSASYAALGLVLAHAGLSLSATKFHVPRERIPSKPMIWSEFRGHNIVFALRSVVCFVAMWVAMRVDTPSARSIAIATCAGTVLLAMRAADEVTKRLRVDSRESTTATMPYPQAWSKARVRGFKAFYAYSQLMATLACLTAVNPAYPFIAILPIQLASLLMTLVRKNLLSPAGYHLIYAASLCLPYGVGVLHAVRYHVPDFFLMIPFAACLFALRGRVQSKYHLWLPVVAARVVAGDTFTASPATWAI